MSSSTYEIHGTFAGAEAIIKKFEGIEKAVKSVESALKAQSRTSGLLDLLKRMAVERGPVLMPDMLVVGHPLLNEPATRFHLSGVLNFDLLRRFIRRKRRR